MPVYLIKIEARGPRTISVGRNTGQEVDVFASRFQHFHTSCGNTAEHNAAVAGRVDELLRKEAGRDVVEKQGASQVSWSGGATMEISKERLLELAEHARTRDEIEAEREPHRML